MGDQNIRACDASLKNSDLQDFGAVKLRVAQERVDQARQRDFPLADAAQICQTASGTLAIPLAALGEPLPDPEKLREETERAQARAQLQGQELGTQCRGALQGYRQLQRLEGQAVTIDSISSPGEAVDYFAQKGGVRATTAAVGSGFYFGRLVPGAHNWWEGRNLRAGTASHIYTEEYNRALHATVQERGFACNNYQNLPEFREAGQRASRRFVGDLSKVAGVGLAVGGAEVVNDIAQASMAPAPYDYPNFYENECAYVQNPYPFWPEAVRPKGSDTLPEMSTDADALVALALSANEETDNAMALLADDALAPVYVGFARLERDIQAHSQRTALVSTILDGQIGRYEAAGIREGFSAGEWLVHTGGGIAAGFGIISPLWQRRYQSRFQIKNPLRASQLQALQLQAQTDARRKIAEMVRDGKLKPCRGDGMSDEGYAALEVAHKRRAEGVLKLAAMNDPRSTIHDPRFAIDYADEGSLMASLLTALDMPMPELSWGVTEYASVDGVPTSRQYYFNLAFRESTSEAGPRASSGSSGSRSGGGGRMAGSVGTAATIAAYLGLELYMNYEGYSENEKTNTRWGIGGGVASASAVAVWKTGGAVALAEFGAALPFTVGGSMIGFGIGDGVGSYATYGAVDLLDEYTLLNFEEDTKEAISEGGGLAGGVTLGAVGGYAGYQVGKKVAPHILRAAGAEIAGGTAIAGTGVVAATALAGGIIYSSVALNTTTDEEWNEMRTGDGVMASILDADTPEWMLWYNDHLGIDLHDNTAIADSAAGDWTVDNVFVPVMNWLGMVNTSGGKINGKPVN